MNSNLHRARCAKNDEFYTLYEDIEEELQHYKDFIKNKIIYLNTDNPEFSQFFNYFNINFDTLQVKQVIATFYNPNGNTYRTDIIRDGKNKIIKKTELKGNGDFRSQECKEILQECDIVITNPPFSLFRDFVLLLEEYNKNYLIIGNMNAICYPKIFSLIKCSKLWLGISPRSMLFITPEGEKVVNSCWFTNIDYPLRYSYKIDSKIDYNKEKDRYKFFDNYNAINVNRLAEIPYNYDNLMGVPITFLCKYNPNDYELLGFVMAPMVDGRFIYKRLIIKRRKPYNE